ncbi:MAG: ribose 5-phosphate isomerase B [Christensenellaceae bacterium]|nr:ribose 5-phosphate isomerase B [Christensenellaceae bacterium]
MKIALGADHGGFELKETVKQHLIEKGYEVIDCGTYSSDSVDYPVFGRKAAICVKDGEADFGVLVCGTGIGISYAANKVPGIRCARLTDVYSAKLTRAHNDSNMMSLGARVTGPGLALEIVDAFLNEPFSNDPRHVHRLELIDEIAEEFSK